MWKKLIYCSSRFARSTLHNSLQIAHTYFPVSSSQVSSDRDHRHHALYIYLYILCTCLIAQMKKSSFTRTHVPCSWNTSLSFVGSVWWLINCDRMRINIHKCFPRFSSTIKLAIKRNLNANAFPFALVLFYIYIYFAYLVHIGLLLFKVVILCCRRRRQQRRCRCQVISSLCKWDRT